MRRSVFSFMAVVGAWAALAAGGRTAEPGKPLRAGMIGLDTSHVIAAGKPLFIDKPMGRWPPRWPT